MGKLLIAILGMAAVALGQTAAPDTNTRQFTRMEYSGGYSYVRWGDFTYNGISGAVAVNLNRWVALVGDAGYYPGHALGVKETLATYWGGPRLSFHSHSRLTPYVQFLAGGAHYGNFYAPANFKDTGNGPAWSLGAGLKARINKHVTVQVFQLDYVNTYFDGDRSGIPRITTGWEFH